MLDLEELVLPAVVDVAVVLLAPVAPSIAALPNSMKITRAPFASMPMKSPARDCVMVEDDVPLVVVLVDVVAVLVCALFTSALVAGALKLPVQPPVLSLSV